MKVFKFLALSIVALSTTAGYASENLSENVSENVKTRPLRSRGAQKELLVLSSLKTAKSALSAKEILEADYKKLARAQRRKAIAEKKQQRENQKKLKMIENFPADNIDTLNLAQFIKIMVMFPQAQNPELEDAIVEKATALFNEGPRKKLEQAERKANYIIQLDNDFYQVNKDHKYWEIGNDGCRQAIKPSRPSVQNIFEEQKPQKRQFAKRMKMWNRKAATAAAA